MALTSIHHHRSTNWGRTSTTFCRIACYQMSTFSSSKRAFSAGAEDSPCYRNPKKTENWNPTIIVRSYFSVFLHNSFRTLSADSSAHTVFFQMSLVVCLNLAFAALQDKRKWYKCQYRVIYIYVYSPTIKESHGKIHHRNLNFASLDSIYSWSVPYFSRDFRMLRQEIDENVKAFSQAAIFCTRMMRISKLPLFMVTIWRV